MYKVTETRLCVYCSKPFEAYKRRRKGGRMTPARPWNSWTCSSWCSRHKALCRSTKFIKIVVPIKDMKGGKKK